MEQVAFSPGNIVPGIELSNDRILQARVFSYPDTQRHRLGANFEQIPVNCPLYGQVINYQRDGLPCINGNGGPAVNYEPNSHGGPVEDPSKAHKTYAVTGDVKRREHVNTGDIDFEQPRALWVKVMPEASKEYLVTAMFNSMKTCRTDIKERMIKLCTRVHPDFGGRLANKLEMKITGDAKL